GRPGRLRLDWSDVDRRDHLHGVIANLVEHALKGIGERRRAPLVERDDALIALLDAPALAQGIDRHLDLVDLLGSSLDDNGVAAGVGLNPWSELFVFGEHALERRGGPDRIEDGERN